MMTRGFVFLVLILGTWYFVPLDSLAQEKGAEKAIQQMVGEDYLYAIDFLFFNRLAEGELRLSRTVQPEIFRAELVGRTLGVASWLSGDRTQTYSSLMELTPDGSLRSVEYTSRIVKRKWGQWKDRGRQHRYDYAQGIVFEEKFKEGVISSNKEHRIPDGQQPVDMLTAFYNLRSGVYGSLVRGAQFRIPTFSGKGFSTITVNVLTAAQQGEQKFFPPHGLLLLVTLDPEVFDTGSGNLYCWLDEAGVPERGIVEDIIGMGDVRGYLVKGDL